MRFSSTSRSARTSSESRFRASRAGSTVLKGGGDAGSLERADDVRHRVPRRAPRRGFRRRRARRRESPEGGPLRRWPALFSANGGAARGRRGGRRAPRERRAPRAGSAPAGRDPGQEGEQRFSFPKRETRRVRRAWRADGRHDAPPTALVAPPASAVRKRSQWTLWRDIASRWKERGRSGRVRRSDVLPCPRPSARRRGVPHPGPIAGKLFVPMFRGNHSATVDGKGRLKLPAPYLKRLGADERDLFVTSLDGESILVYPMAVWREYEEGPSLAGRPRPRHPPAPALGERERRRSGARRAGAAAAAAAPASAVRRRTEGQRGRMGRYLEVWDHETLWARLEEAPLTDDVLSRFAGTGL